MKRVCVMAVLACVLGLGPTARAELFLDAIDHPHEEYIDTIAKLGIAQGYGYQIFRPDVSINRAEFLKILMLAVYGFESINAEDTRCFIDFTGPPQWYWPYACMAKNRGVIHGYPDGTFRGNQTVNLAEALKIAAEAWKVQISQQEYEDQYWYIPYFEVAQRKGLFTYFPKKAGHLLTRSEMAYLIISMGEPLQDVSDVFPLQQEPEHTADVAECGNGIMDKGEQCDDGNTENDDGCSAICIIVDQPVRHAALRLDQRPVSAFSLSQGAKGVPLFAFDVTAGRQDAALTRLSFKAQNGTLASAKDYQLFIDNSGDAKADILVANAVANTQAGTLTFSSLAIPVQNGFSTRVELRGTIVDSGSPGQFSIGFATQDARFAEGIGLVDGRDLNGIELNGAQCAESSICWISVNTIDSPTFNLVGKGNLYITKDTTPVPSAQLLAGEATTDLLRLDFRAVGEDITVKTIRLTAEDSMFERLVLYEEGGTSPLGNALNTNCSPLEDNVFCASNLQWIIPKDTVKTVVVRAIVSSEGQGVVSGATSSVNIVPKSSTTVVKAVGNSSQKDLMLNNANSTEEGEVFIGIDSPGTDATITGSVHKTVLAKILSIRNTNQDADQTPVPTGSSAFGVFTFRAAENNNTENGKNAATIEQITFSVNATNVEFLADSFAVYNTDESSITADCSAATTTGQITVLCSNLANSSVNTVMESGESIELALRGFITNAQVSTNAVSVLRASLNPLGSRTTPGSVKWSDEQTTLEWVDIGQTNVQSTAYFSK